MSIDTAQKRSSVFQVPGIMLTPFPEGSISAPDREQISDMYAGIAALAPIVPPNETCWHPAIKNSSSWVLSQRNNSLWKNSRSNVSRWKTVSANSSIWKKESSEDSEWTKEDEIVPCQD